MVTPVVGVVGVEGQGGITLDKIRTYTGPDNALISVEGQIPLLVITAPAGQILIQVAPLTGSVGLVGQTPTLFGEFVFPEPEVPEVDPWTPIVAQGGTYSEITAIASTWTAIAAKVN